MRNVILMLTAGNPALPLSASAQDDNYAGDLANPLAALISMPIQVNYDEEFGLDNQARYCASTSSR